MAAPMTGDRQMEAIEQAALLIEEARRAGRRIGPLPTACRPADAAAGYAVQQARHRRLAAQGTSLAGHKIGCTTLVMQRFLGIDRACAGGVLAGTVHEREARLDHGDFHRVGVECEIALRLAADLPAAAA